jgi:hypothetical protein
MSSEVRFPSRRLADQKGHSSFPKTLPCVGTSLGPRQVFRHGEFYGTSTTEILSLRRDGTRTTNMTLLLSLVSMY